MIDLKWEVEVVAVEQWVLVFRTLEEWYRMKLDACAVMKLSLIHI